MIDLDTMRSHLGGCKTVSFKKERVYDTNVVIVSYGLNDSALWDLPFGREARGITFDEDTGHLISLPFHKFFNLGEVEETQPRLIRFQNFVFEEKFDGSMITPAIVRVAEGGSLEPGLHIALKTKKSFSSDVALTANRVASANIKRFCMYMLERDYCPIFEFTHPDHKVVIEYGEEPQFLLLAVRCMKTGRYIARQIWNSLADTWGIGYSPAARVPIADPGQPVEIHDMRGIEGFVLVDDDSEDRRFRVKVKTKWYLDRHRMLDVRERDIARFFLEDKLDDMVPEMIAGEVDLTKVDAIKTRITEEYERIVSDVDRIYDEVKHLEGKERADSVFFLTNDKALAKLVFNKCLGYDISDDIRNHLLRGEYIKTFSLRSVTNSNFGQGD